MAELENLKDFFAHVGIPDDRAVQYATECQKEDVDFNLLKILKDNDLAKLKITLGHRKKILIYIQNIEKKSEEKKLAEPSTTESTDDLDFTDIVSAEEKDRRRIFYVQWANSKKVNVMFEKVVRLMKKFCCDRNVIEIDTDNHLVDVLSSFLLKENLKSNVEWSKLEELNIPANIQIYDHCLDQPIKVAQEILKKYKRTAACTSLNEIGYQHIFRHKMLDVESLSESSLASLCSSTEDSLDNADEPKQKKKKVQIVINELKICQLKIYMSCKNMLKYHNENYTKLKFMETKLEILILLPINSDTICRKLASHLGVIFLEDMYKVIKRNSKNEHLFLNAESKTAKLYPLFQNYVVRCLLFGNSNITLTCDETVFENMSADAKYFIFCEMDTVKKMNIQQHLHMSIKIERCTFLDCLNAITEIINYHLNYNVSLPTCYFDKKDNRLYKCQLSAIALIPLYILKYFTRKCVAENNVKNSLF